MGSKDLFFNRNVLDPFNVSFIMPLVPCLYLLWFSYNQMENPKKHICPACKSLCPTTVYVLLFLNIHCSDRWRMLLISMCTKLQKRWCEISLLLVNYPFTFAPCGNFLRFLLLAFMFQLLARTSSNGIILNVSEERGVRIIWPPSTRILV